MNTSSNITRREAKKIKRYDEIIVTINNKAHRIFRVFFPRNSLFSYLLCLCYSFHRSSISVCLSLHFVKPQAGPMKMNRFQWQTRFITKQIKIAMRPLHVAFIVSWSTYLDGQDINRCRTHSSVCVFVVRHEEIERCMCIRVWKCPLIILNRFNCYKMIKSVNRKRSFSSLSSFRSFFTVSLLYYSSLARIPLISLCLHFIRYYYIFDNAYIQLLFLLYWSYWHHLIDVKSYFYWRCDVISSILRTQSITTKYCKHKAYIDSHSKSLSQHDQMSVHIMCLCLTGSKSRTHISIVSLALSSRVCLCVLVKLMQFSL